SDEVLSSLLKISQEMGNLTLSQNAQESLGRGRKEIEEIREFRANGGPQRISKLLDALDDASSAVKQKATSALVKEGRWAEPALREALQRSLSVEVRQRVIGILSRMQSKEIGK